MGMSENYLRERERYLSNVNPYNIPPAVHKLNAVFDCVLNVLCNFKGDYDIQKIHNSLHICVLKYLEVKQKDENLIYCLSNRIVGCYIGEWLWDKAERYKWHEYLSYLLKGVNYYVRYIFRDVRNIPIASPYQSRGYFTTMEVIDIVKYSSFTYSDIDFIKFKYTYYRETLSIKDVFFNINSEFRSTIEYIKTYIKGNNVYIGNEYVNTEYSTDDLVKEYYLLLDCKTHFNEKIIYFDIRLDYDFLPNWLDVYPSIQEGLNLLSQVEVIYKIHERANNKLLLMNNENAQKIVKNDTLIDDTILIQEEIRMAPEDYAKVVANSEYQRSQYDEMVDEQIEVPNVVEIPKKSMLEINILHQYLTGDKDSFNHILTHKVPKDGKKCNWIGKLTDAVIFADYLNITTTKFNECFTLLKGGELKDSNRGRKEAKDSPLYAILYPQNQ